MTACTLNVHTATNRRKVVLVGEGTWSGEFDANTPK